MPNLNQDDKDRAADGTDSPFSKQLKRRVARVSAFDLRDGWWRFLDAWETHRALRRSVYASLTLIAVVGVLWFWAYPWWTERNAISMARQWLDANRLDHAGEAVQQALAKAPERPEVWQLAAELARRQKNPALAVDYSRQAAQLVPGDPGLVLAWATDALLANQTDAAERALATLSAPVIAGSAPAQRIAGEIARRRVQLTLARDHFETALRLDGPVAIDEVPLGTILIHSRDPAERQRGLALLTRWATDREWGANALRTLLGDALDRDDRPAMLRWAEALRVHPRCTLGDIPNCLRALSLADETGFATVLAVLEKTSAANAGLAARLIEWLNQIGRSTEAAQWVKGLPPALTHNPPVLVVAAESLRLSSQWEALGTWVNDGNWSGDVDFLRLVYGLQASRKLGQTTRADELWRTLQARAQTNGVQALFAADALYAWGWPDDGLTLLWMAADQPRTTLEALGTLARHYQVRRDGEGQYRAFRRLHSLRAQDEGIANNFAFFAALTGKDPVEADEVARRNFGHDSHNLIYRSTYAFVLLSQNHAAEALTLLEPVARDWKKSPPLALVYGLALAGTGRKEEAGPVLNSLDPATLTTQEVAMIKQALTAG
jgi:predicted Zn-dependent protease